METVRLKMPPFRIPFYQLAMLRSGGGVVSRDGETFDLTSYILFFNLPGQIIYWDVPRDWVGHYLCLEESFYTVPVEGFHRLAELPYFKRYTPAIQLKPAEAEMMLDIMKRMDQEYINPTPYNKPIIKSYLNNILTFSLQFYDRQISDDEKRSKESSLSQRFKEFVQNRITALSLDLGEEALSVKSCAEALFVTSKHLAETVKRELGLTPTEYINTNLVQQAQKLLRSTDMQVKEIAYQLGFQDAAYFNRLFKKINGSSPAGYRKGIL